MADQDMNDMIDDTLNADAPTEEQMDSAEEAAEALNESVIDDEIVTAVLLIRNKQGAVLPVTKLDNLKMEHQANAHEVFRMCADVQDQISAVRVVGELAQIFQHLNRATLKQVADLLGAKLDEGIR